MESLAGFDWYGWVGLPLIIFFARIADVSLGTMRIIFTSRGMRRIAPILGFVEVFIWIVATSQLVKNIHGGFGYLGYAAGFAAGNYIGMRIEQHLAMGTSVLRIILSKNAAELTSALREAGYGVTTVAGEGAQGPVTLLYCVVSRRDLPEVNGIIHNIAPQAFISVEEVRSTEHGIFPTQSQSQNGSTLGRKSK